MLFDAHTHINAGNAEDYTKPEGNFTIDSLIASMDKYGVDKAVTMINPYIKEYKCSECGTQRVLVKDYTKGKQLIVCSIDKTVLYCGPDPTRKYNIKLMEETAKYKNRIYPFLYLGLANSTINEEVEFFENNYKGQYYGYKLHPRRARCPLNKIKEINSNLPLIVHSGESEFDEPNTILDFAEHYKGKVLIAHACRLDERALYRVAESKNVLVDISPSQLMFEGRETDLFPPLNKKIESPTDIYREVINIVGTKKVLFGSDVPFGDQAREILNFRKTLLDENALRRISSINFMNFINIRDSRNLTNVNMSRGIEL